MYVAIMGYGVVGSGVAELLAKNHEHIVKKSMQSELELKYILDRREFPGDPYEKLVITDFAKILEDDEVKIVVETKRMSTSSLRRALAAEFPSSGR